MYLLGCVGCCHKAHGSVDAILPDGILGRSRVHQAAPLDEGVEVKGGAAGARHGSIIADVRARYCAEYLPPNTFLVVSALADPDFLLEIDAVAALPAE